MATPPHIFISAGETSGDLYGALLMAELQKRLGPVEFFGCGGDRMRSAGCDTVVDARQVAMVGIVEVIPGLVRAWKAFRRLVTELRRRKPALAVLIDFPDFNLRFARKLKQVGTPVLYLVAPQVWAWKRWRLAALRRTVDRLLCIFPFEEPFFREAGVPAEFVGHPLAERVGASMGAEEFRSRYGLPQDRPWIALLPGSRPGEIARNLPPLLEAARRLTQQGKYGPLFAAASEPAGEWIRDRMQSDGLSFPVVVNDTYNAVGHAAAAIVASGTATVETALLGTPMVVVYRVHPLTWQLGRLLVRTPFYSMVNLVAGAKIVPELIQEAFQGEAVAAQVQQLLENSARREQMKRQLKEVSEKLRPPAQTRAASRSGPPEPDSPAAGRCPTNPNAIQRFAATAESMLRERLALAASAPEPGDGKAGQN